MISSKDIHKLINSTDTKEVVIALERLDKSSKAIAGAYLTTLNSKKHLKESKMINAG